jgi:hypothetical protein
LDGNSTNCPCNNTCSRAELNSKHLTRVLCVKKNLDGYMNVPCSGVLMTNGFENDHEGTTGRALYPTISLISHSCQVGQIGERTVPHFPFKTKILLVR